MAGLAPGNRLGAYEIIGAIGAGEMGEVFRARDTKLKRDVAIKVLPAAFADDPERLARFTRETQTLASLNHPNIATIHGIEELPAGGHKVTPLVRTDAREGDGVVSPDGRTTCRRTGSSSSWSGICPAQTPPRRRS